MVEARKRIFRDEAIAKFEQFNSHFAKLNENVEHALAMMERETTNPSAAAKFISSTDFVETVNAADEALTAMTRIKERGSAAIIEAARQRGETTRIHSLLMLFGGLMLSAGFGVLIGLSIRRPSDRLCSAVEALASGDVESPIPHTDYPNETGVMARAIGVLKDIYRKSNDQHWVKSHTSDIRNVLQQAEEFRGLAQSTVSGIAPVVGAGHAALYVGDAQGQFSLLAAYGYRERKHLSHVFRVGEGLVGQCAMEKTSILLTAPKDYIRISSGLGEGPPACVLVLPIIHGERVLAVLELASFQAFSEREKALLEALLPTLAVSMEILDRNLRTKDLLVATQLQAERMEKQAAQLEEQTVEMEAQQAELRETENWFRSIIETAPDGMLVVDSAGQMVLANPMAEQLLGCAPGALLGSDFASHFPSLDLESSPTFQLSTVAVQGNGSPATCLDVTVNPLPDRGGRGKCRSVALRAHIASAGVAP